MSFSGDVKKELAGLAGASRHCRLAELSAVISYAGKLCVSGRDLHLKLETANVSLKETYKKLLLRLFSIEEDEIAGLVGEEVLNVLESVKMWDSRNGRFRDMDTVDGILVQQACCRRAFIRGAFLACGSMSNPDKAYHFEIVCRTKKQAAQLQNIINSFGMEAKIAARKKNQVVYVKEGSHIVDLLNIMEAHESLMNLENVRIVKEVRNLVNRKVNCETANIGKTVNAAVRQMEDILTIQKTKGLESLPDHLREAAVLRLEYPDAPLKELGTYLNPPVGKSGMNHRLRRISEIAAEIEKKGKGEKLP